MDFFCTSIVDLAKSVNSGQISASDLIETAKSNIERLDPKINSFVALDFEAAFYQASELAKRENFRCLPLTGIPFGVKDLEDAKGFVTTKGSFCLKDSPVADSDSLMVSKLKAAGAIVIGKTNTPELGWQPETINPVFGATYNPWNLEKSPGGSSGGSAAAVAAGLVPFATGSDGGGSIRIPAAMCSIVGFKPSLGRIAADAKHLDWPDLSTSSILCRNTLDLAYVLDLIIGPDQRDPRSIPMPEVSWYKSAKEPKLPKTVTWSPNLGYAPVDKDILAVCLKAIDRLSDAGVNVIESDAIFNEDPVAKWLTLASSYNWKTLKPFHNTEQFLKVDPMLAMLVESASKLSAEDVIEAQSLGYELNSELYQVFKKSRLLITPTVAGKWPDSGRPGTINGNTDINWVRFTYPFNMTRSPAGSFPVGFTDDGAPVSIQLIGPQHADTAVLRALSALEEIFGIPKPEIN
jgi:Asp-tRNA(Asn)/Glu-tRNA(Gln) amidotransferase A subunit family amidase